MPFFNECIDSIISQSYTNFELILINDSSKDGSKKIAEKYQFTDKRIKLLDNKGNGIIDALNTAAEITSGRFITRMDSDDIMSKDKLELMRNQLLKKGRGHVCIGGVKYFASQKKLESGYINYANWLNKLTYNETNYTAIFKECTIPSPCWMIYHEDFTKINGFKELLYPEDYDFAFKLWINNIKVTSIKKQIHYWRDHPNRTSRTSKVYQFENFNHLKVKYLIKNEILKNEIIVLWGAGQKGKNLAKEFIKNGIIFEWITENDKKVNKNIYGIILMGKDYLNENHNKIIICCISDTTFKHPKNDKMNRYIYFY